MITIRLLGGAKKAVGRSMIEIHRDAITVSEILQYLQDRTSEPRLLRPSNLLVAINGIDSTMVAGTDTVTKGGDEVTVVSVVHGG